MQPLPPEQLLSDEDYGAIETAVMETARGRWFLAEYARRNRNADTDAVLSAIRRLERLVQSAGPFDAREEVTRGMADIAHAIAAAQIAPSESHRTIAPMDEVPAITDGQLREAGEFLPLPPEEAVEPTSIGPADTNDEAMNSGSIVPDSEIGSDAVEPDHAPFASEEAIEEPELVAETAVAEAELSSVDEKVELPPEETVAIGEIAVARPVGEVRTESGTAELFPIIELDEEAAEALLTQDPPRQELILPTNHLATQRWSRELATLEAKSEVAASDDVPPQPSDQPAHSGLVTFIDEEPTEESESIFSAPLRLEPEEDAESEPPRRAEATSERAVSPPEAPRVPRMTISEIEAMPFAKKALLFS